MHQSSIPDIRCDMLAIRPGMIALRVKHAGKQRITHPANDIVAMAEALAQPVNADHERRGKSILNQSTADLGKALIAAERGGAA